MSTLAEIEKSVSQFSAEELAKLEQIIHKARRAKEPNLVPSYYIESTIGSSIQKYG
jgi:hypothetical protein